MPLEQELIWPDFIFLATSLPSHTLIPVSTGVGSSLQVFSGIKNGDGSSGTHLPSPGPVPGSQICVAVVQFSPQPFPVGSFESHAKPLKTFKLLQSKYPPVGSQHVPVEAGSNISISSPSICTSVITQSLTHV